MLAPNEFFLFDHFSEGLYRELPAINPGVEEMELYEFRYCLDNLLPEPGGWAAVKVDPPEEIERLVNTPDFYSGIKLKPRSGDRIVLDPAIVRLTQMLLVGLVTGKYAPAWVARHFYFDIRGFYFLHRTAYLTAEIVAHLRGEPYRCFEPKQREFARSQDIGYRAFRAANADVDSAFIESVQRLIELRGAPVLIAIAGPTAAGKTEIVARLREILEASGQRCTAIEMDNFLTDRDEREARGIGSLGKAAIHFELFRAALKGICRGETVTVPRYDFVYATSSHDELGHLKPGCTPLDIPPADVIFVEGNFPFLLPEVAHLIGVKVVYLTGDDVRMKRKWKRDIDYRKKYEPTYFRNRFFREQYLMARQCYVPQLALCDIFVDTTGAALWVTEEVARVLDRQ